VTINLGKEAFSGDLAGLQTTVAANIRGIRVVNLSQIFGIWLIKFIMTQY
jgi:hypothetical protein